MLKHLEVFDKSKKKTWVISCSSLDPLAHWSGLPGLPGCFLLRRKSLSKKTGTFFLWQMRYSYEVLLQKLQRLKWQDLQSEILWSFLLHFHLHIRCPMFSHVTSIRNRSDVNPSRIVFVVQLQTQPRESLAKWGIFQPNMLGLKPPFPVWNGK